MYKAEEACACSQPDRCTSVICHDMYVGVYGDVVRVKILYNKRDSALIQFKEPQQIHTGRLCNKVYMNKSLS